MTRKGKLPVPVPTGVEVKVEQGIVKVKGSKGELHQTVIEHIDLKHENGVLLVSLKEGAEEHGSMHGLYRSLINNMVLGVSHGFEKKLEMIGVGYRASVQGNILNLQVGFSHPTTMEIPAGITVKVDKNTMIIINGIDKQKVGQFAAQVRSIRPPEPYQGKGIRYQDEYVRRKAGKAASKK